MRRRRAYRGPTQTRTRSISFLDPTSLLYLVWGSDISPSHQHTIPRIVNGDVGTTTQTHSCVRQLCPNIERPRLDKRWHDLARGILRL